MSSESESESVSGEDDFFVFLEQSTTNGFAFEPEYSASEIEAHLLASQDDDENESEYDADDEGTSEDVCTCEKCVDMEHALERSCCRSFSHVIGNKMGPEGCITTTTAFQDVCLNTNVLEAALGTWHHLTDQQLQISNKSYRFVAYRQFISWIYGWLGKDVRKRIPSCVLNKIRQTFPAADDVYVPYSD